MEAVEVMHGSSAKKRVPDRIKNGPMRKIVGYMPELPLSSLAILEESCTCQNNYWVP